MGRVRWVAVGAVLVAALAGCNDLGEAPTAYALTGDGLFGGDIDGDGDVDLLTGGGDGYGVMLNNGSGTFTTSYVEGHSDFSHVVLAEVNGDSRQDIVSLVYNPGDPPAVPADFHLITLISNGDGTFGDPTVVGSTPLVAGDYAHVAILAADIDGDGDSDIELYKSSEAQAGQAVVFRRTGNNTFAGPVVSASTSPVRTYGMLGYTGLAVADMTGDGKRDLVVSGGGPWPGDEFDRGQVAVLTGNGVGGFTATASYPTIAESSSRAIGPVVGDFNEDGRLDVAVADIRFVSGPETYTFWFGQPGGTLGPAQSRAGKGEMETKIVSGDFNGDGNLDIVSNAHQWADESVGQGWLIKGDGAGGIAATSQLGAPAGYDGQHGGVIGRDFDGDGKLDVAMNDGRNTVTVFLNRLTS